ncbi:MAG: hypothetical protein M3P26_08320, partial [Gemmatimonadota bacterium]|nr:hypothetical protein [Gemmatimonadota bacterium]
RQGDLFPADGLSISVHGRGVGSQPFQRRLFEISPPVSREGVLFGGYSLTRIEARQPTSGLRSLAGTQPVS